MINAKALVRAMKAAYKGGGLKVWRMEWHGQDTLCLCSGYWLVVSPMPEVPGSVLGLVAEWMRGLPTIGRGMLLVKCRECEALDESSTPALDDDGTLAISGFRFYHAVDMLPTNVQVNDCTAFQRRDGKVELFEPEYVAIIDNHLNQGLCKPDSSLAIWQDTETGIVVALTPKRAVPAKELEHLAQFNFWEAAR